MLKMILTDKVLEKINAVDFEKLYKEEKNSKNKERYLAFVHLQSGKDQIEVSEIIRRSRQTIDNWLTRFIKGGLEGLVKDKPGKGRKSFLNKKDFDEVKAGIEALQKNGGHLTANDIKEFLEETFNVKYEMKSIYDVLERLDLSWVSGRSKHPKCNLEVQEQFKKTSKR